VLLHGLECSRYDPDMVLSLCCYSAGGHVGIVARVCSDSASRHVSRRTARVRNGRSPDAVADLDRPPWDPWLRLLGVSTAHVARARQQATNMGRSAMGGTPSDLGLCLASRLVSDLRDPHGARRVRRGPLAHHASTAPSHRPGLSVDAHIACRRSSRCQLEQCPSSGVRFLAERDRTRPKRRPRHLSADEIHRGKAQKSYTVLSDLVRSEAI
jgi:hypothetical protein